jgi:hypothetical protein
MRTLKTFNADFWFDVCLFMTAHAREIFLLVFSTANETLSSRKLNNKKASANRNELSSSDMLVEEIEKKLLKRENKI